MSATNKDLLFQNQFKNLLYYYEKFEFHEIKLDEKDPNAVLACCDERLYYYKYMIQRYNEFSQLIKSVRSIYKLKQADEIDQNINAFVKTWTILNQQREKTRALGKVESLYKRRLLIKNIIDNIELCEKLGHSIVKNLKDIHEKSIEIYSNRIKLVQEQYPFLRIEDTISDHKILDDLISDDAFESKEFKELYRKLLRNYGDKLLPLGNLKFTLDNIKDPIKHDKYFTNVGKLAFMMGRPTKYSMYFLGTLKSYSDSAYTVSASMYFDDDLVRICELLASIRHTSVGAYQGFNIRHFMYDSGLSPDAMYLACREYLQLKNGEAKRVIESLEILNNARFRIDVGQHDISSFLSFAFDLTPEFSKLLLEFKMIRVNGYYEGINLIKTFIRFCEDNNYFIGKREAIQTYWKQTISESIRNLHSLYEFLYIYAATGNMIFDRLLSSNIMLLGYELDGLFENISGHARTRDFESIEDMLSNIFSARNNHAGKMLVLALTTTDYNGALNNASIQLKNLSGHGYLVNVCYTSTPYELEYRLREIAKIRKIDVLFIAGHGDPSGISLGRKDIRTFDIDKYLNNMRGCFSKDAKCFLISCSTGAGETPIAKRLADKFGIPVTGPDKDAGAFIGVDKNNEIVVDYAHGSNAKCFIP